jgi:ribosomal protein L22
MASPEKSICWKVSVSMLALALLGLGGCNRNTSSMPAPLPVEQIPAAMQQAFTKAQPEAQSAANDVVSSVQSQDLTKAFEQLRDLSVRPDLTPEQKAVAARAMVTTVQQLQAAADRGDQKASEFMHKYISTR